MWFRRAPWARGAALLAFTFTLNSLTPACDDKSSDDTEDDDDDDDDDDDGESRRRRRKKKKSRSADDDDGGSSSKTAGCTKDTDCKGNRICVGGSCEAPKEGAPPVAAPVPAPPPVAAPPSPAPAASCVRLTVGRATNPNGAPVRVVPAQRDFVHVPVGKPLNALCQQKQKNNVGYRLCVRTHRGETGWMAHDYLVGNDPAGLLRTIRAMPSCNDSCPVNSCPIPQ